MDFLFIFGLLFLAFLYSSVGHGGGSGYIALMVLFAFAPNELIRSSALILNLFVAGSAFNSYYRKNYFDLKLFLSFAITSIPMAVIGGYLTLDPKYYAIILGIVLVFAALKILNIIRVKIPKSHKSNLLFGLLTGAGIGLISGLVGIGGGILLSPVLLIYFTDVKTSAGITSLFVWINSLAGLSGLYISSQLTLEPDLIWWIIAVTVGGITGSFIGSHILPAATVKKILGFVLIVAGLKLMFL